ncbi:GntR family transcriptional regulator [Sphingomonas sp. MG17]|uniref:GntR family transcriptional regulator n=1 Tax=Sphingomonas tagetis TaxID=2949092 RepID=A0A9X2HJG7_9SPHN|nr:GntR family transcriptional regulator [Sphingomonas tagetis]MCP3730011.1 GntR family transcriptional regulator [Sphingomonas tagetis]
MKTKQPSTVALPTELKPRPRRIKLVDEIIESLRQDIVTRRLPDGERLPSEKELSDRFGVSQPTIREAIRALETLGLVEVLHGNGTFVRGQGDFALASALQTLLQLESVGIMEVIDIRQSLGRLSIELAVAKATDADIAEMARISDQFEQLGDLKEVDDVIARVIGFQRALSAASHNALLQSLEAFLLALLNEVQFKTLSGRGIRFWRARAMDFQPHRVAILDGIRARDAAVARAAMDRYFDAQRERFEQDDILRAINLSNPRLIDAVSDMVRQFRT